VAKIIETSTQRQIAVPVGSLWQSVILGVLVGLLFWVLSAAIKGWVNAENTAGDIATVLVATVGTMMMVKLSMVRPLVVAVAAAISLWGLVSWTSGLGWVEIMVWDVILYTLAYVLFSWLVRNKQFTPIAFAIAIVVVTIRIIASL
jgi:hypothetical protein